MTVTVEATGKQYKALQAAGVAGVLLGFLSYAFLAGFDVASHPLTGWLSIVVVVAGFASYGTGKGLAWWYHG